MTQNLCAVCGEGHVTDRITMVLHKYNGQVTMLPLHYVTCDACHSDYAGEKESKENKHSVIGFNLYIDAMTAIGHVPEVDDVRVEELK